ncbi:sulfur carrier protein ThiS [Vibrio marisflavi]|uniref:Sulfur carrier protein ThiS n=1 Tax=Vibrio marisflavi CECT 7928 TaxID=634439 RepID=A0ABN8E9H3_9VIBR|nr:sulfur carrier protein ThiS [Vibrio marisflavi]CAH0542001.1 Sulfur carrier protein ThiS [Vibrio marisflavi CECT 7928]
MKLIHVTINNQKKQIKESVSLQGIIQDFDLPSAGTVFTVNNQIVPKGHWDNTSLNEGDVISLFQAIAGG